MTLSNFTKWALGFSIPERSHSLEDFDDVLPMIFVFGGAAGPVDDENKFETLCWGYLTL